MNRARKSFHIMTVDVEDWPQSTLDHSLPITERVVTNTRGILELLGKAGVRATFFVLGKVAEAYPGLAREIVASGHEVGTHGYSHESIQAMSPSRFREELHRSVEILKEQTGQPIMGHRAADFSISSDAFHVFEYMCEEGLTYDSSIFPIRHPRYGIPCAWRYPHLIRCPSQRTLIEFPLATVRLAGAVLPAAGGGYFRLFPYWWTRLALRLLEHEGSFATCYIHPYELDASELDQIPYRVPLSLRFSQFMNRRSVSGKLWRLLRDFHFTTMAEACERLKATRLKVGLDLEQQPLSYGKSPLPTVGLSDITTGNS